MKRRCLGCMEQYDDRFKVCPHCGYVVGTRAEEAVQMQPGTLLHDRYIIGRVIGSGGFGVTYLGWDGKLEQKVAIKEYLPSEFSTRMPGSSLVTVFEGEKGEQFRDGMKKLIDESKRLSKFQNEPGIVKIFDSFEENYTAYIVMEYLDGMTLASYLDHVGTIPEDEAVSMLMPLMASLQTVHDAGLLHRDIAPDNIFLTRTGEVKLIDFGAARYATTSHSRSLTVIIKPGYSPEEQYRSNGNQGPHTDVHALAATLYKMITGIRPADAMDRYSESETKGRDLIVPLHKIDKNISKNRENAILNGLNVRIEDRTADIESFIGELNSDKSVKRRYGKIKKIDIYSWPLWLKILIPVAVAVIAIFGILLGTGVLGDFHDRWWGTPEGYVKVPDVMGMTREEAIETLSKSGLQPKTNVSKTNQFFEPGIVIYQDPGENDEARKNAWVYITSCRGNSELKYDSNGNAEMDFDQYIDAPLEDVEAIFKEAGWILNSKWEYDDIVKKDSVIRIEDLEDGQSIPKGTVITVVFSLGPEPFEMPDYSNLNYVDAMDDLGEKGVNPENIQPISSQPKNGNYKIGEVFNQEPEAGSTVTAEDIITLWYVGEKESVVIPDVQGKDYDTAKEILQEAGFEVKRSGSVPSKTVEEGCVINTSPSGNTLAEYGDTIYVTVSSGPPVMNVTFIVEGKEYAKEEQTYGNKYVWPDDPDKVGYEFEGWRPENSSLTLSETEIVSAETDHKLYADFEAIEYYVVLHYNDGTNKSETIKVTYKEKYGSKLLNSPYERVGYGFSGWYKTKEFKDEDKVEYDDTFTSTKIMHLYAKWNPNELTVKYEDADTGALISTEPLKVGEKYNLPTKAPTGYKISGYYIEGKGTAITSSSKVTETTDHTVCVEYKLIPYTASWSTGTGYSITVKRTSSPNGGASIGNLSSDATVYYGDVLSITYTASTGYFISTKGSTSITVTGNVTSSNIYVTASANSYKYTIKYVSTNGTDLGSSSATCKFGTTNTISAPAKSGYITPPSQNVKWNATSKTITFRYTPESVPNSQRVVSGGVWYKTGSGDLINYDVDLQYQKRTANSVQVRVVWTNTILAGHSYSYYQAFNVSDINGIDVYDRDYQIVADGAWASKSDSTRSSTAYSIWYTIPVSSKATSLTVRGVYWRRERESEPQHYEKDINIPAY